MILIAPVILTCYEKYALFSTFLHLYIKYLMDLRSCSAFVSPRLSTILLNIIVHTSTVYPSSMSKTSVLSLFQRKNALRKSLNALLANVYQVSRGVTPYPIVAIMAIRMITVMNAIVVSFLLKWFLYVSAYSFGVGFVYDLAEEREKKNNI